MPLADGGERRREQLRTRAVAAGAGRDLAAARRENGLRAAELAVEVLQGSARIARHEAALQWTGRVLEAIRSAARSGARSPADVARLELEQRGLDADIDADRRDRAALVRELGELLGAPESWSPTIGASHPGGGMPTAADSASMAAWADSSAEVRKAQSDVAIAELEVAGARGQTSLALSLTADAGWAGTGLSHWGPAELAPNGTLSDRLRQDAGASLALELSRPLIIPGSDVTVSAREASLGAARARLERVRREARRTAFDLLGRWWYAARDLPPLQQAAGQAESNLLRAQSLYVAGSLPLLDLLDARRVLEQSDDRAEDAISRLELARAQAEISR
jgi:outer membrane protein TolC